MRDKEGILVTWAILANVRKVLVHLGVGNHERYEAWLEHFQDLVRRGLPTPLTMTTDGAPGLIKAVEAIQPEAERIRCWVHEMANVLDKVPDEVRPILKPSLAASCWPRAQSGASSSPQRQSSSSGPAIRGRCGA